jgi:hypothetical protein
MEPFNQSRPLFYGYYQTNGKFHATETELLRDLLYVFQGVDGRFIAFDEALNSYKLDEKVISMKKITS